MAYPRGWRSSDPVPAPSMSGNPPRERRHCRHEDRPEPQECRFLDRDFRRQPALALGLNGEVHHHDAVLLHDADQKDDADDADHRQIEAESHQHQKRAHAGGRQRRQDRQRVDEALIQHAEDDVDHHERRDNQERRRRQRALKGLRVALEASGESFRRSRSRPSPC